MSDEGTFVTVVTHVKNARRVCDAVGAVSRKPSSQIMENSSESLSGASCRGRLVRGRLCYCDVWLRSCRETEGQRKRAMEWNKHVARRERVKVSEHTHSIAAQERKTPALMTATTAVESLRFLKRGWSSGEWNTNRCSFVFLLSSMHPMGSLLSLEASAMRKT